MSLYVQPDDHLQPMLLQATIDPITQGAGTIASPWFSAADFAGVVAFLQTGLMGASGTIDAKLQQATDVSGTGAKDIAGKAITQIVKASGDNKQAVIRVPAIQIDFGSGFAFVRLCVTVGAAASQISGAVFGVCPRHHRPHPVAGSVAQIII
jgi:hypothetical protein